MHVSKTLRRLSVVVAASSLLGTVPFAAPASAATPITQVNPIAAPNTGPVSVDFVTPTAFAPAPEPTVTLKRTADPSDVMSVSAENVTLKQSGKDFTVVLPLTRENPGAWNIEVTGVAVGAPPESGTTTDSCSGCFTVLGFKPTISAPTPSAPVTLGGGTTKVAFTVNGTNFTDDVYCTTQPSSGSPAPCANEPTLAVTPSAGITFFGSGASDAEQNATATAITKRISIASSATPGARDIVVTNTDGKSETCAGCLVVAPAPTLTSVAPAALGQGVLDATLVLTGTNFGTNPSVTISRVNPNDTNGVTTGAPVRNSATQITIPDVDVTATAPQDVRRITITNNDSGAVVSDTLFRINNRPIVSSVAYPANAAGVNEYGQGARSRTFEVVGQHFQPGAVVTFANPTGITQNGAPTVNAEGTRITLNVTLDEARASSAPTVAGHAVSVTNPDRGVSTNATPVNFTVDEGPRVTAVSPASRGKGQTVNLTLTGTDFDTAGVTVTIDAVTIDPSKTVVASDGRSVTVEGVTSNATNVSGVKNVTVLNNADKGQDVCVGCFAIDNLQADSMSPSTVLNDVTQSVTIAGSGFALDAVATLVKIGTGAGQVPDIAGTTTSVNEEGTSLVASFPFAGVAPGGYRLRVTNPTTDPGVGTCLCTMTVIAPTPTISLVAPSALGAGADDETVVINGSGFAAGAAVEFTTSGITVVSKTVTPTKITMVVDVAPGTTDATGQTGNDITTVTVRNTDNKNASSDFDVNKAPAPASMDVTSRAQGTVTTVVLTGDEFVQGAKILFSGTGVTAGPTTFTSDNGLPNSDDTLAAQVTVAADAPTGARTVTVLNPDGGRGSCACFAVNAKPVVASVTPAKGARGTSPVVTIAGTGFVPGSSTVTVSGAHVTPTVTATTPTSITVTFAVGPEATIGHRDVTVTNTDGGVGTMAAAFKVFTTPGAPTGVTATRGAAQATVSWTAPAEDGNDPLTEYVVTAMPGALSKTVPATDSSTTMTGLANGTAYTFTVVARNAAGSGPASAASAPVTPATTPDAPVNVTATAGEGAATVTWAKGAFDGGSPLTGFTVRSNPGNVTKAVGGNATTTTVDGLANGTAYTFTVVATNAVGDSAASAASSAVTPFTVPDAPTNVAGTRADGAVNLSWSAPAFDGGRPVSGYTVKATPGDHTKQVDGSLTSAMVDGLTNGTAYTFTVVATNDRGASAASAPSAAVTPYTIAGAPKDVQATPDDGSATVTWVKPDSDGGSAVTGYVVTVLPGGATQEVGADTFSAVVTGLTNGTAYTFTVGAVNAAGTKTSAESAPVTPRTVPGVPTAVSAVRGDESATVSWTAPASDGGSAITGYTVTATPGGATKTVAGNATSALVEGLTNGTSYTFTVVATNVAGNGAASDATNAVVPAGVPTAPDSVVATAGNNGTATVSWASAEPNGSGITGYTVTSTPGGFTKTLGGTARSTAFSGLTDGVTYTFAVTAVNDAGTGPAGTSNAVTPRATTVLSLSVPSQVVAGGTATLRGVLSKTNGTRLVGQPIRVYARQAGSSSFVLVRHITTGADGAYSTAFTLSKTMTFVTIFPGTSALHPYRSAERVTKVAYKVTAAYSLSGRTLTASGAVSPNAAGRLIYLRYRRSDGTLVTLNYTKVASNGTYRISKGMAPGTYNTFVYIPAGSANTAGQSPFRSITIR